MRVLTCVWMIEVNWVVVKEPPETQLGSCEYQTRLWQRMIWPLPFAKETISSPWVKVKTPCSGSVASYGGCSYQYMLVQVCVNFDVAHPFHLITRRDLTEHGLVAQDRDVSSVAEFVQLSRRTEVLFADCLGKRIKASRSWLGTA